MTLYKPSYPVEGVKPYITSKFNTRRSYGKHEGIDLAAVLSNGKPAPLISPDMGQVAPNPKTGYAAYGGLVIVRYKIAVDNDFETLVMWFAHLSKVDVTPGQIVDKGERLGTCGTTGNSTGIHLHVTVQWIGHGLSGYCVPDVIDPYPLFFGDGIELGGVIQPPVPPEPIKPGDKIEARETVNMRKAPQIIASTDVGNLDPGLSVLVEAVEDPFYLVNAQFYVHKDYVRKVEK